MTRPKLIVLAPLLIAGCEVVFGIKESSSGTGGPGGGASTSSASTGPEAGADAPSDQDAGDGGAPFSCASHHGAFLCADFDDDGGLAHNWDSVDMSAADMTSAPDQSSYSSSPTSFRVTTLSPFTNPSTCTGRRLVKDLDLDTKAVHVDFDFSGCDATIAMPGSSMQYFNVNCKFDPADGGAETTFGLANWGLFQEGYQLTAYGVDPTMNFKGKVAIVDSGVPTPGVFKHVHIDVTFDPQGTVTLTVDGVLHEQTNVNTWCPLQHKKALSLGILGCTDIAACEVHFDNVLVAIDH